jgi:hypothetical protein
MNRRLTFVIAGVVLVGALVGGALIGFIEHRGSQPPSDLEVIRASEDVAVEAISVEGRADKVLATYPVTTRDLDSLGIPRPEWPRGEPKRMMLVAMRGAFTVPRVTITSVPADPPMTTEIAIQVIDLDHGGPTITVLTTNQDLIHRVLNHLPAASAFGD